MVGISFPDGQDSVKQDIHKWGGLLVNEHYPGIPWETSAMPLSDQWSRLLSGCRDYSAREAIVESFFDDNVKADLLMM